MSEIIPLWLDYRELKARLHGEILEEMDLESLSRLEDSVRRKCVCEATREMLGRDRTPLASSDREQMRNGVVEELLCLGPIEPVLADRTASGILANRPDRIYVERRGVLERTELYLNDEQHLMRSIERIVSRVGRRINKSTPMVDARLEMARASTQSSRPLRWMARPFLSCDSAVTG